MLKRFGVSIPEELLTKLDQFISKKGYSNRSEAIRDLVRDQFIQETWETNTADVIGTVTLVYNHHVKDLSDKLTDLQHSHHEEIISTMHIHLDAHNCLEVLVVKGQSNNIRLIADKLISTKGVQHGKLVMTAINH